MNKKNFFALATPIVVGLALILAAFAVTAGQEETPKPRAATVKLYQKDRSHGTAFHVGGGIFVTAKHVIETMDTPILLDDAGVSHVGAKVLMVSAAYDIAILKFEGWEGDLLPVSCKTPGIGYPVSTVGYPTSMGRWTTQGYIATTPSQLGDVGILVGAELKVQPGNSGGPLVANGRVVGVVVRTYTVASMMGRSVGVGYTWAEPAEHLCETLFPGRLRPMMAGW